MMRVPVDLEEWLFHMEVILQFLEGNEDMSQEKFDDARQYLKKLIKKENERLREAVADYVEINKILIDALKEIHNPEFPVNALVLMAKAEAALKKVGEL